jgi:hypothetical protein
VRLFLWELKDGRLMAWFCARGETIHAQLFASVLFDLQKIWLSKKQANKFGPIPSETEKIGGVHWWWMACQ